MQEFLKKLEVLDTGVYDVPTKSYKSDNLYYWVRISNRITANIEVQNITVLLLNGKFEVFDYENNYLTGKIPFEIEDKNEFFQLSTVHDFHNFQYDDYVYVKSKLDYIIKRYMRESSNV